MTGEDSAEALARRLLTVLGADSHLKWAVEFDDDDADDDDDDDDDDDKDDLELKCVPDTGPTTLNQPYLCTCIASGGEPPYTIALDPKEKTLPTGLTFTFAPGADVATISGTPTQAGAYAAYRVFVIDSEGGYDDHEFDSGTITANGGNTADAATAQGLFAGLGGDSNNLSADQAQYVSYAVAGQDPQTGKPPDSSTNPYSKNLSPSEIAAADNAVQAWLRLGDSEIWENLASALEKGGAKLPGQFKVQLLELCKEAKGRTLADRSAVAAYRKQWPPSSRVALVKELVGTKDLAEMCTYMQSYRPSGLLRNPPFELGAEVVLVAIAQKWPLHH